MADICQRNHHANNGGSGIERISSSGVMAIYGMAYHAERSAKNGNHHGNGINGNIMAKRNGQRNIWQLQWRSSVALWHQPSAMNAM